MTKYVLGFAFDGLDVSPQTEVALIRKLRPDWQNGHLNGIGGHIEDEVPHHAMVREFEEETGLLVPQSDWNLFAVMGNSEWQVQCFRAFNVPLDRVETKTDEEVGVYQAHNLPLSVLTNLRWLIPMALDRQPLPVRIDYP